MKEAIDRFESGGPALRRACAGLTPRELTTPAEPGKWSIQELVIHLADMDAIAIERMKRVITEDNPALLYARESRYIERLFPHEQSLDDALTLFEIGRRQAARTLRELPAEAFDRSGTHNQAGEVTLRDLVADYSDHLDHHLGFLTRKRERLGCPLVPRPG